MLKIINANLNGIRSASRKNFFTWFLEQNADFLCVQELRAQAIDMQENMLRPRDYHGYFHYAQKKGYSGTGLYTKHFPSAVQIGFKQNCSNEFNSEGRYVELRFPGLIIISVYFPSGSSSELRQDAKFRFLDFFLPHLQQLYIEHKLAKNNNNHYEIILCGDINIAHKEIDLKNWRGNLKNSGFLPEERAWMSNLFDKVGYVDVFRKIDHKPDQYTWWSNRGAAYAKNVGWRIDYQIATPKLAACAVSCQIYKEQKFSDHAPLIINYDTSLRELND